MSFGFWLHYLSALLVVALMLLGLYVIVRSLARGRIMLAANRRLVNVVESTFVAPQTSVHVVKVAGRYFLVGGGNGKLSLLAELPAAEVEPWLEAQRRALAAPAQGFVQAVGSLWWKKP
ncbi:MAG: flagellar biosynthetic protein FliO [Vulcanimicrobiaceae bacterium]